MKLSLTFFIIVLLFAHTTSAFRYDESDSAQSHIKISPRPAEERGLIALDQALRELANPYTIMCVAAHPDDADFGSLAFYRKRLGARVVIVFVTRGEATPSHRAAEVDASLGVVRTIEAINAARVVGADVYFLNLRDIGHSKSAEEALGAWDRKEALSKLIEAIRRLRPDVIITNHNPSEADGQHQAIARLTQEAFDAAGDTKAAPGATSEAWQARRLFQIADEAGGDVSVSLDEYDQTRGRAYREIEREALKQLASYGPAIERKVAEEKRYYRLARSATGELIEPGASLIDRIPLPENLARSLRPPMVGSLQVADAISQREKLVESLGQKLEEKRAEGSAQQLHERYGAEFFRIIRMTEALERALALALGIDFKVTTSDNILVRGQKLVVRLAVSSGSIALPVAFHAPEQLGGKPAYKMSETTVASPGRPASKELEYQIPKDAPLTVGRAARLYEEQYYAIGSALPGALEGDPFGHRLVVIAEVGMGQVTFPVGAEVRFDVAPAVEISTIPFAIIKDWSKSREVEFPVRVRNRTAGSLAGALWVVPLALTEDNYEPLHMNFSREDEELTINMKLRLPILKPPLTPDVLMEFRREKPAPPDPLGSTKITVKALEFEVAENLTVGYVAGADRWLESALAQLGVERRELNAADIKTIEHGSTTQSVSQNQSGCRDLSRLDAIIVDERAYFLRPDILSVNNCLLEYAKRGGNLVVLAQQPDDFSLILSRAQLAPYAIRLSKDRVTVESAPVKIIDETHALVTKPNRITAKDFEGWVAELAFFLPREWATEFTALIETADPNEEPGRGSLLAARYGEGSYIYTTLALRRQMIEANPGAYRILANLISLTKNATKTGEQR